MQVQNVTSTIASNIGVNSNIDSTKEKFNFKATLENIDYNEKASYIEDKINEITLCGEKLMEKADIGKLNKYKSLIKDLVNYTVNNGFKFSKSSSFDSRGRGKVYGLIKKVDSKLDDLTQMILEQEKDNIDIIAQINDIRGLIVDMFL